MLVKPRPKEHPRQRATTKQCVCNKCHKSQTYKEVTIQIQFGFNAKKSVLIDGIERQCSVCGWHVDDIEVSRINREIAEQALQSTE